MKFTLEQRAEIEEILPAVVDDPESAAAEIVQLQSLLAKAREALRRIALTADGADAHLAVWIADTAEKALAGRDNP